MGRNMFGSYREDYIREREAFLKETTLKALNRRYKRIERELLSLCDIGQVSTTSPKLLKAEDFESFVRYRRSKKVCPTDLSHDITALNAICLFAGNTAVSTYIAAHPDIRPKRAKERLDPLAEESYKRILQAAAELEEKREMDIKRIRPYVIVLTYICTGARNSELRNAMKRDLDTKTWVLHLEEVKGKGSYGKPRDVPIPDDLVPVLEYYLKVREFWLFKHDVIDKDLPLFISLVGDHGCLSSNSMRKIKSYVERDLKISFKLQDCRRAFGQHYKDNELDMESISKLMGHNNTKTTEDYYCGMRQSEAVKNARGRW